MYHKHSGGAIADIAGSGGNGAPPKGTDAAPPNTNTQSHVAMPTAEVATICRSPKRQMR
jgi:hypothetical protein